MIRLLHEPPHAPDAVAVECPAHLHIDLLARVRGQGLGRALVERSLGSLLDRGVSGVHVDVAADNTNGIAFYRHLGFAELEWAASSLFMGIRLG